MNTDFHSIDIDTENNKVLEEFEVNDFWNLAVTANGKYKGFISKSNIFNKYLTSWTKEQIEDI
ncbi:MAG: hypothetical protein WCA84_04545 [Ignavibacteriaceae bacterium]|jgi:hypothetical protein